MKGTTDEVVLEKNCGHVGVLPGEKVQMVRKVVGCGCVCVRVQEPAPVWLVGKDFAHYFPFSVSPASFLRTEAIFTQQHVNVSMYTVFVYRR